MNFRIGFGYDVHQLVLGREFCLGGIKIPFEKGGLGHSDADVLIHVICDALLGAANLGDIGKHFPDNSDEFKDIDSKILLKRVMQLVRENKYEIVNIDSTICLQFPKLSPHIEKMKLELSNCMDIDINDLSIKATTTEKLGFVGSGAGVSAYATVMINKVGVS
ncbi:MAG: 2-C-methyl-D-erythritol 2,4-cyclodiphosphate synthase [Pelagibacterales bacterium]|nr:2-C-methyl-D-erythritol 2,4-cyclodiphosphate synthase [Pelagibacterales bacterium]MBL6874474.1 2-C-methyl-D-erythritol 2,4-cyclodiphosphate synthase [Flavobacteriales bacterium]